MNIESTFKLHVAEAIDYTSMFLLESLAQVDTTVLCNGSSNSSSNGNLHIQVMFQLDMTLRSAFSGRVNTSSCSACTYLTLFWAFQSSISANTEIKVSALPYTVLYPNPHTPHPMGGF